MSLKISVAIIGGGLGGCILARGLVKHPHIDFTVYEGGPEFSERGASVGIGSNARKALDLISGDLIDALEKAGGVKSDSSVLLVVRTGRPSGSQASR